MALLLKSEPSAAAITPPVGMNRQMQPAAAPRMTGASRLRPQFSDEDLDMARSLSALHIRYGIAHEAVPYLMMIRRERPQDIETTRLLALAMLKLGKWNEADHLLSELDVLAARSGNPDGFGRLEALWRSLVLFKTNRFREARDWFSKFTSAKGY
ncbi:MAG: hypothetical protein KDJ48_09410 [Nitratireductor sp.]|nr:hypothetical protein [Nitratireductor sp.]